MRIIMKEGERDVRCIEGNYTGNCGGDHRVAPSQQHGAFDPRRGYTEAGAQRRVHGDVQCGDPVGGDHGGVFPVTALAAATAGLAR